MMIPSTKISRLHPVSDTPLLWVSLYLVPVFVGMLALLAVLVWPPVYDLRGGESLSFQAFRADGQILDADQALQRAQTMLSVSQFETGRSEQPVWVVFGANAPALADPPVYLFPSRHATQLDCWRTDTLTPIGAANREKVSGQLLPALGGFRLDQANGQILCRFTFVGPARMSIQVWPVSRLEGAQRKFERNSGLIDGGVGILAAFALMVAIVNRDKLNILFAAWLIANMRMAALSAGWDTHFLEHAVPADWLAGMRAATMALYYLLTAAIFRAMFQQELAQVGERWALRYIDWSPIPLVLLAFVLPYQKFLPLIWVAAGLGIGIVGFLLYRILRYACSWMAFWYALSLGIILASSLYEVIAAALGLRALIDTVNSITAAIFSSLMAAVAIAEHIKREHEGRLNAQAELQHAYDVIPIGLFTLNPDGTFYKTNPALEAMLGQGIADDTRLRWGEHFEGDAWLTLMQALEGREVAEIEVTGRSRQAGVTRRFLVKATYAADRIEGSLQDITERHAATEILRHLSEFDALTSVLNRRGIELELERVAETCSPTMPMAVAYLDLDRFKLINDLFGHAVGDDILKQVCQRLRQVTKQHRLGRMGGDEFLIVMENLTIASARLLCRQVVNVIADSQYESAGKAFRVNVSVGLVEILERKSVKEMVGMADRACRMVKVTGAGVHVFEANSAALREHQNEIGLIGRFGVDRPPDGLFLVMQPILSLHAPSESLNFEVLLRLREPDGSIVPAGKIIAAAENSGRSTSIDRWVLSSTLAWLENHKERLGKTRFVSMNLSGASLSDEVFVKEALAMLKDCQVAKDRLCLEVTESVALRDTGSTRSFLEEVRRFGIRVALDDFGAGYTSFSYLRELPADVLKIDGSFVIDAARHPASLAIIEAIAQLARNFGMQTIAEWAEDLPTLEALAEVGIDYVQGYIVSRPVAQEAILVADSVVDLIRDPRVATFVRSLGAPSPEDLPDIALGDDPAKLTLH